MWQFLKETSNKDFFVLLLKILDLETKHLISTPAGLSLLFQEKMWLIKKEVVEKGGGF